MTKRFTFFEIKTLNRKTRSFVLTPFGEYEKDVISFDLLLQVKVRPIVNKPLFIKGLKHLGVEEQEQGGKHNSCVFIIVNQARLECVIILHGQNI